MEKTRKIVLSAMFFALGIVLPFFTGQIPAVGKMLLPMHIPVMFCGLIVGWQYGLIVGLLLPVTRSVMFGMPPMFPTAISMAFELATYGSVAGYLYSHSKWQCTKALYRSLITAMVSGRLVWAFAQILLLGLSGSRFTLEMFLAGAFLNAVPGILLQLFLIPAVMVSLNKAKVVMFQRKETSAALTDQKG